MAEIIVPLTERERQVLDELAEQKELPPERVMVVALRLYQLVSTGHAEVRLLNQGKKLGKIF